VHGNHNRAGASASSGDGLGTAARRAQAVWPTPTARDRKGAYPQQRRGQTGKGGPDLATAVLWPTPKASTGDKAGRPRPNDRGDLQAAALRWPTPTAADAERTSAAYPGGNPTLLGAARQWPTPTASNPNERETLASWAARRQRERAKGRNGNGMGTPLGVAVRL
jgi:hypothetical protein